MLLVKVAPCGLYFVNGCGVVVEIPFLSFLEGEEGSTRPRRTYNFFHLKVSSSY